MSVTDPEWIIRSIQTVIQKEAQALMQTLSCVDAACVDVIRLLLHIQGKVILSGMGKSGFIAQKISATMASLGISSFYVHPADLAHGDLGRLQTGDVLIILSKSGETQEFLQVLKTIQSMQIPVVLITHARMSTLGRCAQYVLCLGHIEEACELQLAPSSSTTTMLALGDALALTLARLKQVTHTDFARYHPGGTLGYSLMTASDLMRRDTYVPRVPCSATIQDTLHVMTSTQGRPGCALIVDEQQHLCGLFTDGDLRRLIEQQSLVLSASVYTVMTQNPRVVYADTQILEVQKCLRQYQIDNLPVVNAQGQVVGLIDVQDLMMDEFHDQLAT